MAAGRLTRAGRWRRCARIYREVERIAAETVGWRLFTILRYRRGSSAPERALLQR